MPRNRDCCASRGWPSEVTVLKWLSIATVTMLALVTVAMVALCIAVLQLVEPARQLTQNATVAATTVTASIEAMHVEEWHQTVHDLDAIMKSDGVAFLTSQWASLGIEALMESISLLASHLDTIDFDALAIILNGQTMQKIEHILRAVDRGVMAYENAHVDDVLSTKDLVALASHLRNLTQTVDGLAQSLSHHGIHFNLGVDGTP